MEVFQGFHEGKLLRETVEGNLSIQQISVCGMIASYTHRSLFGEFMSATVPVCLASRIKRVALRRGLRRRGVMVAVLVGGLPVAGLAQGKVFFVDSSRALPDSPGFTALGGGGYQGAAQQGTSSVTGVVLDISEAGVAGATVTLARDGDKDRVLTSEDHGAFQFTDLAAGTYHVTISAKGLETFVSDDIVLKAGERRTLPEIALPVANEHAEVNVTVTQSELATAQVKAELQQRVFGVLPNFYSSYIWNAAPLRPKNKIELAFRSLTDPAVFVTTGITAGIQQAEGTFNKGYGQGAAGYGRRYGAAYGDVVVGRVVGSALLPMIFHQDPRYFYLGTGSVGSRAWYAISRTVITRQDNRRAQFNYSHILGSMAAGAVSKLYHPGGEDGVTLVERNLLIGTGAQAAVNLVREFVLRKVVTKIPVYEQGKAVAAKEAREAAAAGK